MTISFTCPYCGKDLQAAEDRLGESGPCAECGAPVVVEEPRNRFAGAAQSDRFQIKPTPWGILFGVGFSLTLLILLVQAATCTLPRNHTVSCMNNMKEVFQAVQVYESRKGTYPLASTQPFTGRPGSYKSPHPAGYSWHVPLLPYLGRNDLHDQWMKDSHKFQLDPFDPANSREVPAIVIPAFICPASSLERVELNQSDYQPLSTSGGSVAPARSSYVAFAATHFTNAAGPGQLFEADPGSPLDGNGLFPFPKSGATVNAGFSASDIIDGLATTFALCETLEPVYAAWCDGQATWTVGAWPGNAKVPTIDGAPDGLLGWPGTDNQSWASIESGSDNDPAEVYLPASRYHAQYDRRWGPSSRHGNGAVIHMFADGHSQVINRDIDRNLYLRLISRDKNQNLDLSDLYK